MQKNGSEVEPCLVVDLLQSHLGEDIKGSDATDNEIIIKNVAGTLMAGPSSTGVLWPHRSRTFSPAKLLLIRYVPHNID